MQLREIHAMRFGVLQDVHVTGLSEGLNVLYGPNEFGKTSLLELVRRILFGFPDRRQSKLSQYIVPGADKNAGRLVCELRNGTTIDVVRTTGKGGGPLAATTSNGSSISEDAFMALLGHASKDLYRNVFSLDLADLFETDVTDVPEIRDRLYGAGLGGVWPTALRAHFEERAEELYKKGGHAQVMKQLADRIARQAQDIEDERRRLAGYDDKKAESDCLHATAEDLAVELRKERAELRSREDQVQLYSTVHDMHTAQQTLAGMGDVPEVEDATAVEVKERQSMLKGLSEQRLERENDLREKRALLERVTFDPALLEHENEIRSLSHGVTRYRSILDEELPGLRNRSTAARERLEQLLSSLGADWTIDRLRTFALTTGQRDSLRQQEEFVEDRRAALEKVRQRLGILEDQALGRASARRVIPTSLRVAGIAVLVFGGAGAAFSAVNGDTATAVLAGVAGLVGLLIALVPGAGGSRDDPEMEKVRAQLQQAEESLLAAETDWSNSLARSGLSPTLSPQAKEETLRTIDDARRDLNGIDEVEERITYVSGVVEDTDTRYAAVAKEVGSRGTGVDIATAIELLAKRLDEAREESVRRDSINADVEDLERRIGDLKKEEEREQSALRDLLASHGVSSVAELEDRHARFRTATDLRRTIAEKRHDIETRVGPGEAYVALVQTVETTPLGEIRSGLDSTQERIATLEAELDGTNRNVGALDSELKTLEAEQDIVSHEAELETLKQTLRDAYREWLVARIALWGIDTAVSRYEEERQPQVIRAGEHAFSAMTGGRYIRLIKSMDSQELHVRGAEGNDRTVEQLSRGTREQLYLAMRLGLIEQYEQNAESLPVIMDDVLVNFDDERAPRAVEALAAFAKDRQVIVMTCHERTRELYRNAGAIELALSAATTL